VYKTLRDALAAGNGAPGDGGTGGGAAGAPAAVGAGETLPS